MFTEVVQTRKIALIGKGWTPEQSSGSLHDVFKALPSHRICIDCGAKLQLVGPTSSDHQETKLNKPLDRFTFSAQMSLGEHVLSKLVDSMLRYVEHKTMRVHDYT